MNHKDILLRTAKTVTERTEVYGDPADTYSRASIISSTILGKEVSRYDVAIIMHAVKLSRTLTSPRHLDNYEDGINFLAFAAEFVGAGGGTEAPPASREFNRGPTLRTAPAPGEAHAQHRAIKMPGLESLLSAQQARANPHHASDIGLAAVDQALAKNEDDGA